MLKYIGVASSFILPDIVWEKINRAAILDIKNMLWRLTNRKYWTDEHSARQPCGNRQRMKQKPMYQSRTSMWSHLCSSMHILDDGQCFCMRAANLEKTTPRVRMLKGMIFNQSKLAYGTQQFSYPKTTVVRQQQMGIGASNTKAVSPQLLHPVIQSLGGLLPEQVGEGGGQ